MIGIGENSQMIGEKIFVTSCNSGNKASAILAKQRSRIILTNSRFMYNQAAQGTIVLMSEAVM
jgi:hypothetical protein